MLNNNFLLNKKSEIGETLTWIVAFLLIFFIMVLFTISCMAIAAGKGFTKDKSYTAQPVSGDISLINNFIQILNKEISVDAKTISLIDYLKKYPYDSIAENDIRCMFIESGSSLNLGSYYPSLYINDKPASVAQATNCEEALTYVGYSRLYATNKNGLIKIELKFFNCDLPILKKGPDYSGLTKESAQKIISSMESSGAFYDSYCERLDFKKKILKDLYGPFPGERKVTLEEENKITLILRDKINIDIVGSIWKYDPQRKGWTSLWGDAVAFSDEKYMRKNLVGEEGSKNYLDLLNAKKENNMWVVPMKNV